jgi:hypothetical protein
VTTSPLVSIVINNHNYGCFVAEAVESALLQTYSNVEVIVVDDGSTDSSKTVINRFGTRIASIFKENEGQASTFNVGFEASNGEFVIFLDADDFLLPTAAQRAADLLSSCDAIKVHWPLWKVDEDGNRLGSIHPQEKLAAGSWRGHMIEHGPVSLPQPPTSGNAWRRSFLQAVLPLPEHEDKHGADGFLRKLAPLYGEMRTIDEPQGCYRVHSKNYGAGRGLFFTFRRALKRFPIYCDLASEHLARLGFSVNSSAWRGPGSEFAWLRDSVALYDDISSVIPLHTSVVLVDNGMLGAELLPDCRVLPFLERDGQYWGPPRDAHHALDELARMRNHGAQFFLIAFPAFWWFDFYPELRSSLHHHYPCIHDSARLVAFDLSRTEWTKE